LRLLALLSVIAVLACEPGGPPPFGFEQEPTQRFVFEAEEQTEIDETPVSVVRYAELALDAAPAARGRTELALRIERYYMRIEGAPGGTREIAVSPRGLVLRDPDRGEIRLEGDEEGPEGRTLQGVLREAIASAVVQSDGALVGDPWRSRDPALQDLPLIEWILLALPIIGGPEESSWTGRRSIPPLGQYQLGSDIPLRFEWADPIGRQIRSSGFLQRQSVTLADGFSGLLQLDHTGQATLFPTGALERAKVELRVFFRPEDGADIRALYRAHLRCAECPATEDPSGGAPTPEG
jgi:hypothetical protein